MRAAGVPSRVVTGYQGGELNTVGNYMIVRQADAHAWVEVWLANDGWVRVDPTAAVSPSRVQSGAAAAVPQGEPLLFSLRGDYVFLHRARLAWDTLSNSWNQIVLGYTAESQRELMRRIGIDDATWHGMLTVMFTVTGVITLALAFFTLRKLRSLRPAPAIAAYARFCEQLARRGMTRHPSEGPLAFGERAAAAHPKLAASIGSISELYIRLRYGKRQQPGDMAAFQRAVAGFASVNKS